MDFWAFSDELVKISAAQATIPVVGSRPAESGDVAGRIRRDIEQHGRTLLGHKNIAVPVSELGELAAQGFKKTRLAVPLPGERIGTPTWRKGDLHAHKKEDYYLFHIDSVPPEGIVQAAKHWVREGLPASKRRIRERKNFVGVVS